MTLRLDDKQQNSSSDFKMAGTPSDQEFQYYKNKNKFLQHYRKLVENKGLAKLHGDTLEKREIYVDQLLNPSTEKDLKKIKYFNRVSFALNCMRVFMPLYSSRWILRQFFLRLKISESIKGNFLVRGRTDAIPEIFSLYGCVANGDKWDTSFADFIRKFRDYTKSDSSGPKPSEFDIGESDSGESDGGAPDNPIPIDVAVLQLVNFVEVRHDLRFLDKKFPLFGFMRDAATDTKKHPKLYLWRGEADAIAYSRTLKRYVIVDFKVVNDLLSYCDKKTVLCGEHLHQCLLYAKLLQLHMGLEYLPPSLIVVIHQATGIEGSFPLFQDYPKECYDRLGEYEWFTKQPSKRPLKIKSNEKLLHKNCKGKKSEISPQIPLQKIFEEKALVKDLLDVLGYDSLELV